MAVARAKGEIVRGARSTGRCGHHQRGRPLRRTVAGLDTRDSKLSTFGLEDKADFSATDARYQLTEVGFRSRLVLLAA